MAIYHLNLRGIAPSRGSSAVRSAAYQSGEELVEEATGETCRYARAERVVASGIELPEGAPAWAADRSRLWNEATAAHAGGTALVAVRHEIALPRELSPGEQRQCVLDYCARLTARGHAADWAIHDDGNGNPHAHILETALEIGADGFARPRARKSTKLYLCRDASGADVMVRADDWKAAKAAGVEKVYNFVDGKRRTLSEAAREGLGKDDRKSKTPVAVTTLPDGARAFDAAKAQLVDLRAAWAEIANRRLAEHAARTGEEAARIDHRSYADQGSDLVPTVHEGRAPTSEVVSDNRRIRFINAAISRAAEALAGLARRAAAWWVRRPEDPVTARRRAYLAAERARAIAVARRYAGPAVDDRDLVAERLAEISRRLEEIAEERRGMPVSRQGALAREAQELVAERAAIKGDAWQVDGYRRAMGMGI